MSYDPFDNLNTGDPSIGLRLPYLEDGYYKLKVTRVKGVGRSKPFYVIETEVVESNVPSRPPGMRCASFIDLSNKDMRGKNTTSFLAAVHGVDPTTLMKDSSVTPWDGRTWSDYAKWSIGQMGQDNPLEGKMVGCAVQTILTQEKGEPFSQHQWIPIDKIVIPSTPAPPSQYKQREQGPDAPGVSGGFAAPAPQPGAMPPGWGPGAPAAGPGAPLGGFAPPAGQPGFGGPVPPAQGAPAVPPGGWGQAAPPPPQGAAPAPAWGPGAPAAMPGQQLASAAPLPSPQAPAAPTMAVSMPEQWLPHPQDPGNWEYNPQTGAVRQRQAQQGGFQAPWGR